MSLAKLVRRPVHTVDSSCTIVEAARRMRDNVVGALVITEPSRSTPLGIITDRDLVVMVAEGLDPREAAVSQFLRLPLQTATITDGLPEVTRKMRDYGIRRLPILDTEGRLAGLVALDDVLVFLGEEMADVAAAIRGELDHERELSAEPAAGAGAGKATTAGSRAARP